MVIYKSQLAWPEGLFPLSGSKSPLDTPTNMNFYYSFLAEMRLASK